jgi:hypothetical protein
MKKPFSTINRTLLATAIACGFAGGFAGGAQAAAGVDAAPLPAFLAAHDTGSEAIKWQAVGDDVLASQSGKFANGQMISGFVLNLLSQWNLPNGSSALAQGSLTVSQNAANQMSATVSTMAHVLDGNSPGGTGADPSAAASGGQRIAVNGVSQVTQVAGDRNLGMNAAQIDFNTGAALAGGSNATNASASNLAGNIRADISFGNGGVTVALQTPAGLAAQTIAPGAGRQAGSIAQLVQIAGNNQQVANQLQLHLQTAPMSPTMLRQAGVMQALQNAINARR